MANNNEQVNKNSDVEAENETNSVKEEDDTHDPDYPPIITLPEVLLASGEEDEDILLQIRAKLYRFEVNPNATDSEDKAEWKERGTGDVKILKHQETDAIRIVMRRDKTYKLCANHYIAPWMQLKPSFNSNRSFVWRTQADYSDEECKSELLAIRFRTEENAKLFKTKFEDAVKQETSRIAKKIKNDEKELSELVEKVEISK